MTNFEKFTTSNIDTLARFLDKHGAFDGSPWMEWWDKNYCKKCEPIKCDLKTSQKILNTDSPYVAGIQAAYCELEGYCKFFPDLDYIPDNEDIIRMWLELEEIDE